MKHRKHPSGARIEVATERQEAGARYGSATQAPWSIAVYALSVGLMLATPAAYAGGSLVWEREAPEGALGFGARVGDAGDVNGDGKEDVLVSTGVLSGRVYVLSGTDGAVLRTFTGNVAHPHPAALISAVAAGDFDGDGVPDVILGARANDDTLLGEPGYLVVVSGKSACDGLAFSAADCAAPPDGCTLRRICGAGWEKTFGDKVANVGDLDGDGTIEILAGVPGSLFEGPGEARLYSGADGHLLLSVHGTGSQESLGYAVAGIGDVTGDGVPDFAIGAPGANEKRARQAGHVLIYSGASRALVRTLKGKAGEAAGASLAGVGPVNGDRLPDLAYGSPGYNRSSLDSVGQVRLVSGRNGRKLRRILGNSANLALGTQLVALGDVDGDGGGDFAAGTSPTGVDGQYGRVGAYSGKCGCGLFIYEGPETRDGTGGAIGAADVTGDGKAELIVGAPDSRLHAGGVVRVFAIP